MRSTHEGLDGPALILLEIADMERDFEITVRCTAILGVRIDSPYHVIKDTFDRLVALGDRPLHILQFAFDWLSIRSAAVRTAHKEQHSAWRVQQAHKKAAGFVGYYSCFAGCTVVMGGVAVPTKGAGMLAAG